MHFLRCLHLIKWLSQTALPPPKSSCSPRGAAGLRQIQAPFETVLLCETAMETACKITHFDWGPDLLLSTHAHTCAMCFKQSAMCIALCAMQRKTDQHVLLTHTFTIQILLVYVIDGDMVWWYGFWCDEFPITQASCTAIWFDLIPFCNVFWKSPHQWNLVWSVVKTTQWDR